MNIDDFKTRYVELMAAFAIGRSWAPGDVEVEIYLTDNKVKVTLPNVLELDPSEAEEFAIALLAAARVTNDAKS